MRVKSTKGQVVGDELTPGLRRYLYCTAAMTGASIMIVQILGAKMMAPYLGTSHFVWTAQIAVTMVALATGYYAGGRLADHSPRLGRLYAGIVVAALYLAGTMLVIGPVAYGCLRFKLAMGSLLTSAFLFFVPLSLLAMVGPFFVRVMTQAVSSVGGNMGRLTAIGTLGSFAGTLLIGYVLIPFLPNAFTMLLTSAGLFAVAGTYFAVWGRKPGALPPVVTAAVVGLGLGLLGVRASLLPEMREGTELYRANSNFGMLQVVAASDSGYLYYLNDYLVQNTYDPIRKQSVSMFTYLLEDLAKAYTPEIRTALCVGLGVGIVPMRMAEQGMTVDVVEINPAVVKVAREYFDCRPELFRQLELTDARYFLNQTTNRYDTIILDAFLGDSSPVHLMSREAFESMHRLLRPDGTVVINCFVDFRPSRDFFGTSLYRTLSSVFREVRVHSAGGGGNVFFVASDRAPLRPVRTPDFEHVHPSVRRQSVAAYAGTVEPNPNRGMILTDDFNPVEARDAANREEIRRHLARSARAL
jgi:spermidine synthase